MTIPSTGDPEIDRALAELAAQTAGLDEARRKIEETKGRGESVRGQVVVEVGASGSLVSLHIDPRAMRLGSQALAEAITEAFGLAEQDVADKSFGLARELFER
ncbi:YbaB/EbfC family nucleoid-associated protein [Nonomuraea sp. NPDC002799]